MPPDIVQCQHGRGEPIAWVVVHVAVVFLSRQNVQSGKQRQHVLQKRATEAPHLWCIYLIGIKILYVIIQFS